MKLFTLLILFVLSTSCISHKQCPCYSIFHPKVDEEHLSPDFDEVSIQYPLHDEWIIDGPYATRKTYDALGREIKYVYK